MTQKLPRGLRNNNPLNIIHSKSKWVGLADRQPDTKFCTFQSLEFGIRAAMIILRGYIKKGFNTPEKIISRWAPEPDGNDVARYVSFVCAHSGILPSQIISFSSSADICKLAHAMALFECGVSFADYLRMPIFLKAYDMV